MEHYIDKTKVISEIEKLQDSTFVDGHFRSTYFEGIFDGLSSIERFMDTLELKEVMPALDNGKMPIERWREAVQAASDQAIYRKNQGLTETCDDYFVDGVQWADEHPAKIDVDLEEEIELVKGDYEQVDVAWNNDFDFIARHFYELGLKARKGGES